MGNGRTRYTLAALAAAAAPACATVPPAPEGCGVEIRFGSYAMGIDRGAAAAVEKLAAEDPDVTGLSRTTGGREGEYALCARTRNAAAAQRLFERIRALLPPAPRGPITLLAEDLRYVTPAKRK